MNNSVGNDLVDLSSTEARLYASNGRFVARVLTEAEQAFYYRNYSPKTFWMHWAAKEAVYKLVKKLHPETVLSHQTFEFRAHDISETFASGTVTHEAVEHEVEFTLTHDWIHCTSSTFGSQQTLTLIQHNDAIEDCTFTAQELGSIYSKESRLVRALAKTMLKKHFSKDFEIRRPMLNRKFGPPCIWHEGRPVPGLDLSLSHDHHYCAVAIGIAACNG